jgi:hypothetical protein
VGFWGGEGVDFQRIERDQGDAVLKAGVLPTQGNVTDTLADGCDGGMGAVGLAAVQFTAFDVDPVESLGELVPDRALAQKGRR